MSSNALINIKNALKSEKIILGSGSPRRKEIFEYLNLNFEIQKPDFDEEAVWETYESTKSYKSGINYFQNRKINELLETTVKGKVSCIQSHIPIFCFDTIVVKDGRYFGKPRNKKIAKEYLSQLANGWQKVITGCAVKYNEFLLYKQVTSKVRFKKLTEADIDRYLESEDSADAVGAYKVQGKGLSLVREIKGCYHNVVGLPLSFMSELME